MQLPGFVDSHADEKDYELTFHFGRHPGINYLCHATSSLPEFSDLAPVLFKGPIRLRSFGAGLASLKNYTPLKRWGTGSPIKFPRHARNDARGKGTFD